MTRDRKTAFNVPTTVALGLALTVATTGRGGDSPDHASTLVVLKGCEIEFERAAVLGAGVSGLMKECLVRPGDRVKAGQVLGRVRDEDAKAELELKEAQARSDIEVRLNRARQAQAVNKLKRSALLHQTRAVSSEELEADRLGAETARLAVEEAEQKRKITDLERQQAEALLRSREFTSPHDGVIVAVKKAPGESILMGEPVFRVVNTEKLRVTGALDVTDAWRVKPGQVVRLLSEIPGAELNVEREVFEGRVVFVDAEIDKELGVCKVVAEVDNRDNLLRAGLFGRLEIIPLNDPEPAPAAEPKAKADAKAAEAAPAAASRAPGAKAR